MTFTIGILGDFSLNGIDEKLELTCSRKDQELYEHPRKYSVSINQLMKGKPVLWEIKDWDPSIREVKVTCQLGKRPNETYDWKFEDRDDSPFLEVTVFRNAKTNSYRVTIEKRNQTPETMITKMQNFITHWTYRLCCSGFSDEEDPKKNN